MIDRVPNTEPALDDMLSLEDAVPVEDDAPPQWFGSELSPEERAAHRAVELHDEAWRSLGEILGQMVWITPAALLALVFGFGTIFVILFVLGVFLLAMEALGIFTSWLRIQFLLRRYAGGEDDPGYEQ